MIIIPTNATAKAIVTYSDDFNRADTSSGLGSNWTAIGGSTLGIASNQLCHVSSVSAWPGKAFSYYKTPFDTSEFSVSFKYQTGDGYVFPMIGAPGVGWIVGFVRTDYAFIYSLDANGNPTGRGELVGGPLTGSQQVTVGSTAGIRRTANLFEVYKVGYGVLFSYTDSANAFPQGTYRYAGIGVSEVATRADDWVAQTL